jgi:hypothetical protein
MVSFIRVIKGWFRRMNFHRTGEEPLKSSSVKFLDKPLENEDGVSDKAEALQKEVFNYKSIKDIMTMPKKSKKDED